MIDRSHIAEHCHVDDIHVDKCMTHVHVYKWTRNGEAFIVRELPFSFRCFNRNRTTLLVYKVDIVGLSFIPMNVGRVS